MEKIKNSGVLIDHIEEAKDWLDKAKEEYTQANNVRGDIILNLAQAEVKHAWELSRCQSVSNNITTARNRRDSKSFLKKMYLLPAAALIIVGIGIIFWMKMDRLNNTSKNLATIPTPEITQDKIIKPSGVHHDLVNKQEQPQPVVVANQSEPIKPSANNLSESKSPVVVQTVTTKNKTIEVTETTIPQERREANNNTSQPRVQPVTQLTIDEEALTKEASHSLRNGK